MPVDTWPRGSRPIPGAGVTTPASINAATALTLPTTAQALPQGSELEVTIQTEGASTSRWTINGVTPTAAVGELIPAGASIFLRGKDQITAFQIIGTAAGNSITYQFTSLDVR